LPFPGGLKPGLGPYGTCPEGLDVRHVFQDESRRIQRRGRARVSTHRATTVVWFPATWESRLG